MNHKYSLVKLNLLYGENKIKKYTLYMYKKIYI